MLETVEARPINNRCAQPLWLENAVLQQNVVVQQME
jgi:hypothetical protein